MNAFAELIKHVPAIEIKLGYRFKNPALLALAFVHRSYINEQREITRHNERLEFLGDSILGLLIADFLYRELPDTPEGDLSYLRSRLVEAQTCVSFIQMLDVERYMLLGKGERMNDGRGRDTILSDLFEAILGAIYLDGGLDEAKTFIFRHFAQAIAVILKTPVRNWKALLQDFCQKKFQKPPHYAVLSETGADHSKIFTILVSINNEELGRGQGASKKEAQQSAAADALSRVST